MLELIELGWGRENPAYRQIFTSQFIPDSKPEQQAWFNELERMSTTPANAVRIISSWAPIDVTELAQRIRCPVLVLHARDDARMPFEEGRLIAGLVPGARFVPLESGNHVLLEGEPAFARLFAEFREFLREGDGAGASESAYPNLTPREREILECIADGMSNKMIARALDIADGTVKLHVKAILRKLGMRSRVEAAVAAVEQGLGRARRTPGLRV